MERSTTGRSTRLTVAASGWRSRPSQVVDVDVAVELDVGVGARNDVHGRRWQQVYRALQKSSTQEMY